VLPGRGEHGIDGIGCQVAGPDLLAQFAAACLGDRGWPVRPGLAHRMAGVGSGEDPPGCRDRCPGQAAVVAGPVEALVGKRGDRADAGQCRGRARARAVQ
jgi:hypothetical protein